MKSILFGVVLLVLMLAWLWPNDLTKYPPGVMVYDEPAQSDIAHAAPWKLRGYTITPLAEYRIRGRVLATERYWLGREADLSPLDLSLGWRRMSDQAVLDRLTFIRERRALSYRPKTGDWPIPLPEIVSHCANMHMIPANAKIDRKLKSVSQGDIVDLTGSLVEVTAADGWRWRSSLVRTDEGPHACELMWVTNVERDASPATFTPI